MEAIIRNGTSNNINGSNNNSNNCNGNINLNTSNGIIKSTNNKTMNGNNTNGNNIADQNNTRTTNGCIMNGQQNNHIYSNNIEPNNIAIGSFAKTEVQCKEIWRIADAVCFDVDSTVCCDEAIDELASYVGKSQEVSDITRNAMQGGANFREALAKRLDIIQPSRQMLEEYLSSRPPKMTDHVIELVDKLHKLGRDVYLVSGGFDIIIQPAARILNIPFKNIFANSIKFFFDGSYAGFEESRPTSDQDGKKLVVAMLKKTKGYKNIVMVGDGKTDLEACPPADAFIGFGGNQIRETVRDNCHWFVYNFNELITELP